METIAFFVLLSLGLFGWYGMMHWDRHNAWWMRAAAVLCFFGLTGAGRWLPDLTRIERERTELTATERNGSQAVPTLPNGSVRLATDRRYLSRYEQVTEEIGPPPHPAAVPVVGYVTAAGVTYPSRWRMPPNADTSDNLKAETE